MTFFSAWDCDWYRFKSIIRFWIISVVFTKSKYNMFVVLYSIFICLLGRYICSLENNYSFNNSCLSKKKTNILKNPVRSGWIWFVDSVYQLLTSLDDLVFLTSGPTFFCFWLWWLILKREAFFSSGNWSSFCSGW